MGANPSRPQLVAVDANVLFDLAAGAEDVVDSMSLIRGRLKEAGLLMPPTVQHELANWAVQTARSWRIIPANLTGVSLGIAERIALRLREVGLVPEEELHDSFILAESALLECSMLLTSDEHLRGIDFERLAYELQAVDVAVP